jgi:uncharacterized membrane protein
MDGSVTAATRMSEPESLAQIEALDEHLRRHSYDRLLMLSDGIFAIAITLAALNVRIPAHAARLGDLLAGSARSLVAYGLSFLIAGIFWASHRNLFARLRRVDGPLTVLTLAMLSLISLIPATISGLYVERVDEAGFHLYGLTMFTCGLVNLSMWAYAAARPGLMIDGVSKRDRWIRVGYTAAFPVLFLPVLLLPPDQFAQVMFPLVVVVLLFRRVLLPRWMGRPLR